MYKKMSNSKFIVNCHGTVIVEFVFVVFIITLLINLMISVAAYQSTVGKLDRISYSIAGIVRERGSLYADDIQLTQNQVAELKKLAEEMLLRSGLQKNDIAMTVETLHFHATPPEIKSIDNNKTLSFSMGACQPTQPLHKMIALSPYTNTGRWLPLYQVTLCLSASPWYTTLFSVGAGGSTAISIKSSAVTIER
ncbi:tight adherence pilus pseudopilin TadF [Yersinia frederiksenii]|uniref:tight adherence pilus pseudopilin TadF n=1 Tax=Yersinia frederiksenii TaxID=29484 RepID=UPI0005E5D6D0|nr:tight adherence pilus pseudopilin TadF [Yersinia frederiksenii]CQH60722.1 putative tight adherance operon protein [Yersinia frederiksenii]